MKHLIIIPQNKQKLTQPSFLMMIVPHLRQRIPWNLVAPGGNKISYDHIYNPDATVVPAFNKTKFMSDGSIEYAFKCLSEGSIEGFVLGQTAQISIKRGIK